MQDIFSFLTVNRVQSHGFLQFSTLLLQGKDVCFRMSNTREILHLYLQDTKLFGRYLLDMKLKPFGAPSSPNEGKCIHLCPSQHMDSVLSSFH